MKYLYLIIYIAIGWFLGITPAQAQHQIVTGRLVLENGNHEEPLSYAQRGGFSFTGYALGERCGYGYQWTFLSRLQEKK